MKKKLMVCALVLICLSVMVTGTLAFFTKDVTAHNVITAGGVDVEINEWANEDKTEAFPEEGITGVMPATAVTKIVEVTNIGASDAYVRISVEKTIELAEGVAQDVDENLITLDFNTTDWELNGDFYYYKNALKPGETTAPLFTQVAFEAAMGNPYQNCTVNVVVNAQAVQVANNTDSATTASGWPA